MLSFLLKRRKPTQEEGATLPLSVEFALAGLSAICRPDTDDTSKARVLLQWACDGSTVAWHHEPNETRRRLAEAFPALTPGQIDLALRAVGGLVRAAQVEQGAAPAKRRSEWASWPPARTLNQLPEIPR